jgi:hypothetical protein
LPSHRRFGEPGQKVNRESRAAERPRAGLLGEYYIPIVIAFDQHGSVRRNGDVPSDRRKRRKRLMRPERQRSRFSPKRQPPPVDYSTGARMAQNVEMSRCNVLVHPAAQNARIEVDRAGNAAAREVISDLPFSGHSKCGNQESGY